jgi:signal transduction histidine kinase/ligand-binding sensor domain-containing protein
MKINIHRKFLIKSTFALAVFLIIGHMALKGQEIILNKVPSMDGESVDFVTGITQDANGLMWFSTKVGLKSYDGKNMAIYKNNPFNPNSLVSNFTESVCADNFKIWVGTLGQGLDLFDPASGIFTHFRHDPNDSSSISNDTVTCILKDRQGILWFGTHGGLNQYDPKTKQFIHYKNELDNPKSISSNQVRVLYEDREGTLWVGTGSPYADNGGGPLAGGLNRMDKKTGTFTRFMHDPENKNSLTNNKIGAIYEDTQGILWIGTARNEICKMNIKEGIIERLTFDPSSPVKQNSLPMNPDMFGYEHITFITQDNAGNYFIGTTESGVFFANPSLGNTPKYGKEFKSLEGFTDRGAWNFYTTRDGIFWLGSIDGNIYRINPSPRKIPHFSTPYPANSIFEAPNGDLWISTEQKIIKKETNNGISKQSEFDVIRDKIEFENVQIIREDHQGNIWIGGNGGVAIWDKMSNKLLHFKNDPKNRNSLSNNSVITIYEDKQKNIWIGTTDGINLLNKKNGGFKKYYMNQVDTSYIGLNIITAVLQDKGGQFWVGTWNGGGVYAFDPKNNKTKNYLSGTSIVCIYEDTENVKWLGSNYGLFRYDPYVDNFVRYLDPFQVNGISSVLGIIEDNEKYLWISTNSGLARINPERNETNKLDKAYGLENSNFSWNSYCKGRDGKLYFGDAAGYYAFNPAEVISNTDVPEIVFTGFRLADNIVNPGADSPLKIDLSMTEEINLGHDQNIFSFDYAIIDYVNPEENQLTYFLENYDKNWQQPNSERRAYYFNVPPGKYTFHIRGANSYGIWAEKKINIIISPPWWKSFWAYGIYGLLFLLLVFVFDRIQRNRIQLIERQKNYKKELAQAKEIEKAYIELKNTQTQLIQSEKMASLGELTAGIAHEIQNPLNFVNNFSEVNVELIAELKEELEAGNLEDIKAIADDIAINEEKILQHGKRADSIVKGMLQHSRSSNGVKEPTNLNALSDEYLRLSYHGLRAKDKSFNADFITDFDPNLPKVEIIPQDIGRVILNLINNAFYACAERSRSTDAERQRNLTGLSHLPDLDSYQPTVTVSTKNQGNHIEISVKDNGNGIPEENKNKIFQPFFTTKPTGQGTGLGLSLSYDIVKAHGGELKVESTNNQGTEFIIQLPV